MNNYNRLVFQMQYILRKNSKYFFQIVGQSLFLQVELQKNERKAVHSMQTDIAQHSRSLPITNTNTDAIQRDWGGIHIKRMPSLDALTCVKWYIITRKR